MRLVITLLLLLSPKRTLWSWTLLPAHAQIPMFTQWDKALLVANTGPHTVFFFFFSSTTRYRKLQFVEWPLEAGPKTWSVPIKSHVTMPNLTAEINMSHTRDVLLHACPLNWATEKAAVSTWHQWGPGSFKCPKPFEMPSNTNALTKAPWATATEKKTYNQQEKMARLCWLLDQLRSC